MTNLQRFPIDGKYGKYGGKYIPETLVPAISELEEAYEKIKNDSGLRRNLTIIFKIMQGDLHRSFLQRI